MPAARDLITAVIAALVLSAAAQAARKDPFQAQERLVRRHLEQHRAAGARKDEAGARLHLARAQESAKKLMADLERAAAKAHARLKQEWPRILKRSRRYRDQVAKRREAERTIPGWLIDKAFGEMGRAVVLRRARKAVS